METKDPALTKTPISSHDPIAEIITETNADHHIHHYADEEGKGTRTLQETVVGSNLIADIEHLDDDIIDGSNVAREAVVAHNFDDNHSFDANSDNHSNHHYGNLEAETSVTNNTDTVKEEVLNTRHVKEGANPARQPDRRDQQGSSAFDDGINEDTVGSVAPKSDGINDMNRYANVDNAQSRILNVDEKD